MLVCINHENRNSVHPRELCPFQNRYHLMSTYSGVEFVDYAFYKGTFSTNRVTDKKSVHAAPREHR